VLDLLGPRWRREARLAVGGGRRLDGGTLTPASFDGEPAAGAAAAAVAAVAAGAALAPTDGGSEPEGSAPAAVAVAAAPTIAPRRRPPRSHTTMLRIARRHHDLGGDGPAGPGAGRRRLAVLGIVLAMAAAAAVGVAVAGTGGTTHSPAHTNAAQAAAARRAEQAAAAKRAAVAAADDRLLAIARTLAVARARALTRVLNATSQTAQATSAAAVQRAYRTAAARAGGQGTSGPVAATLSSALSDTAAAYGRLAAGARADRPRDWNRAWTAIGSDERRLQAIVGTL
jgi:hypothetical protein